MDKDIEEKIINSFIEKRKKERARYELWGKDTGRGGFIWDITGKGFYDGRFSYALDSHINSSEKILDVLKKHGAPNRCYVMSPHSENDGKIVELREALDEEIFSGVVLISCIHGKLAYLQSELGPTGEGTAPMRILLIRDIPVYNDLITGNKV